MLGFSTFDFNKMVHRSIVSFFWKNNDGTVQESGSAEAEMADASIAKPSSEPVNKKWKFEHVYQDQWA